MPSEPSARRAARCARGIARASSFAALALAASCALVGSDDVHLAPLYTRVSTGDGGVEVEALGGFYRQRFEVSGGERRFSSMTAGPLLSRDEEPNGDHSVRYLVPLGYGSGRGQEELSVFFPFFLWVKQINRQGKAEWRLVTIAGLLAQGREDEGREVAWFPFGGRFEDVLTFDELFFVMWPFFMRTKRGETVTHHALFPVFAWTRGGGKSGHRLWPFYGVLRREGRYDRRYVLWPIFHHQRNHLGEREQPETAWLVFPLFGRSTRGSYAATTWLWPFFGYSRDSESGFWALDFPFPLVRIQRGQDVRRTRFWPLYSYLEADGLEARSFLWPIVHARRERSASLERDSFYVVPLWQSWRRTDLDSGLESSWHKLFPLFQHERRETWSRGSFPTFDPFWKNDLIDRHFGWAWKVWEWEVDRGLRRERSLLGLWRREDGPAEKRSSFAGLWAARSYEIPSGKVRETSLLFGLLRWRVTEGEGFAMLPPAFPGPGWPLRRVHRSREP